MIKSAEEFIKLRTHDDPEISTKAAYEEAPIEVWKELIEKHPDMRFWVAQNKTVPLEILHILAKDKDPIVRSMVADKNKLDIPTLKLLCQDSDGGVAMRAQFKLRKKQQKLKSHVSK